MSALNSTLYPSTWPLQRTVGTCASSLGEKCLVCTFSEGRCHGYVSDWLKGVFVLFEFLGRRNGKPSPPLPVALVSPAWADGHRHFSVKRPVCVIGWWCIHWQGWRKTTCSFSGAFFWYLLQRRVVPRNSNIRVLVLTPPFESQMTLTKSLNLSQPKNRNSFTFSTFHKGCSEHPMRKCTWECLLITFFECYLYPALCNGFIEALKIHKM